MEIVLCDHAYRNEARVLDISGWTPVRGSVYQLYAMFSTRVSPGGFVYS